jgi:3',5'-cyclic AMP phosphodiesterase CpdA
MPRRLYAVSDLHVGSPENLELVRGLRAEGPDDWLVLAGDIGEEPAQLMQVLSALEGRFAEVIWVPGNHDLWTCHDGDLRGDRKYRALVEVCRSHRVSTPEDPYLVWRDGARTTAIVPMFLLYDYSFRPDHVARSDALAWAAEQNTICADEELLWPDPYPSREAWCDARVEMTERRLAALPAAVDTVLINHFPLRRSHAVLPRIPRFSLWCGTTRTDDWHVRFRARAVIYGHLHIPRTHVEAGVTFEEVSLGYPRQHRFRTMPLLRTVLVAEGDA